MDCGAVHLLDLDVPDPKGRPIEQVSAIRDDIAIRVGQLVAEPQEVERASRF